MTIVTNDRTNDVADTLDSAMLDEMIEIMSAEAACMRSDAATHALFSPD
jgi:hypothetical protein